MHTFMRCAWCYFTRAIAVSLLKSLTTRLTRLDMAWIMPGRVSVTNSPTVLIRYGRAWTCSGRNAAAHANSRVQPIRNTLHRQGEPCWRFLSGLTCQLALIFIDWLYRWTHAFRH